MNEANRVKFFAAEIGAKIPTIDLHGFYIREAMDRVDIFLYQCIEKKSESARIIYGGGTGKLREAVLEFIKRSSLILDYQEQGGQVVVLFK